MFSKLRYLFLKRLYKLFVFRTVILNKDANDRCSKLNTFCSLDVETNQGTFTFVFKEDRRHKNRAGIPGTMLKNHLVELRIPDTVMKSINGIEDHVLLVVNVILFKTDYRVLTDVLMEVYLDTILDLLKKRNSA